MVGRKRPYPHHRVDNSSAAGLSDFAEGLRGVGGNHPTTDQNHRALSTREQLNSLLYLRRITLGNPSGQMLDWCRQLNVGTGRLDIHRQIDGSWPRPTRAHMIESSLHRIGQLRHIGNAPGTLDDWFQGTEVVGRLASLNFAIWTWVSPVSASTAVEST